MLKKAIFVVLLGFIAFSISAEEVRYIINERKVMVRSSPGYDGTSTNEYVLRGGQVYFLEDLGEWSRIQKTSGFEGYVLSINLGIEPDKDSDKAIETVAMVIAVILTGFLLIRRTKKKGGAKGYFKSVWENAKEEVELQESGKVICKHCGYRDNSKEALVAKDCTKSPSGKHAVYSRGIQDEYVCRVCGRTSNSLKKLTHTICNSNHGGNLTCKPK